MAVQDYDLPTEPLCRERRPRELLNDAPQTPQIDKGTLYAGLLLLSALFFFILYMMLIGPTT